MQLKKEIETIAIIGAGNVGWHLAIALSKAGFKISYIVARSEEAVRPLLKKVNAKHCPYISSIAEEPDLYLICVQDKNIREVALALSSTERLVAHTSGSVDMEVFKNKNGGYGVLYPLQTFTRSDEISYTEIPFLVEADQLRNQMMLESLALAISGNYRVTDSAARRKVHLAAVFACNFSNHMATIAGYLLDQEGLDYEILRPLMNQTIKKLDRMTPLEAQTGPAVRNDQITMDKHMELLGSEPELREIYNEVSKSIRNHKLKNSTNE